MYILQLFDNHSATYSALIIGCSEVNLSIYQSINLPIYHLKHKINLYQKGDRDGLGLWCRPVPGGSQVHAWFLPLPLLLLEVGLETGVSRHCGGESAETSSLLL